jgi:predicted DsbA family dithiol-disulfide isomerase
MRGNLLVAEGDVDQKKIFAIVTKLGMDLEKFKGDLRNRDLLKQLREDKAIAETFHGSAAAPLFFVNGRVLQGAPSLEDFDKLIVEEKSKALKLIATKGIKKDKGVYEAMRATWRGASMAKTALEKLGQ